METFQLTPYFSSCIRRQNKTNGCSTTNTNKLFIENRGRSKTAQQNTIGLMKAENGGK